MTPVDRQPCPARRVHPLSTDYYCPCSLNAGHEGDHATVDGVKWADDSPHAIPVDRQPVNRQDEWWEKPGRVEDLRLRFKPDGLLRLARSTPEYYDSHGHYLPGLAVLAYLDGQRVRDLEAALREIADYRPNVEAVRDIAREALAPAHICTPENPCRGCEDRGVSRGAALAASPEERGETT